MTTWTKERETTLVKLIKEDGLSFAMAAIELGGFGHTHDNGRSACIGKAHRLGLVSPRPVVVKPRRERPATLPPAHSRPARMQRQRKLMAMLTDDPQPELPPTAPNPEHKKQLSNLENDHCHYPLWGNNTPFSEQFYCGTPGVNVAKGLPYCPHHAAIAFNGYRVKRAAAPVMQAAE